MRLTNEKRRRMVREIMADVPVADYAKKAEKRALELAVANLPTHARAVWNDKKARGLLGMHTLYVQHEDPHSHYHHVVSVTLPGYDDFHAEIKKDEEFKRLVELIKEQKVTRDTLEVSLRQNINACVNTAMFAERFPELVRYLPEADRPVENLPATTELIDGLKAAGLELDKAA